MFQRIWPFLAIGIAVLLFGNAFPAAEVCIGALSAAGVDRPHLVFIPLRFAPAALIYLVIAVVMLRRECWALLREHPIRMGLAGMFVVTGYNYCFNAGLETIAPGVSSLIIATAPIQTALLAWPLLGDRIHLRQVLGIVVAGSGLCMVVLLGQGKQVTPAMIGGAGITLLAPTMWGLYTIMLKPVMAKHRPLAVSCVAVILGTIPILPLINWQAADVLASEPLSMGAWSFLSLGATVIAFYLWNVPLRVISPTTLAFFVYLIPIVSNVFSILVWGNQAFNWWIVFGGLTIILGITLANRALWARRGLSTRDPALDQPSPAD